MTGDGHVFDDHADQALREEGSYAAARLSLRRAMADAAPHEKLHYRAVLRSLEQRHGVEEDTDA